MNRRSCRSFLRPGATRALSPRAALWILFSVGLYSPALSGPAWIALFDQPCEGPPVCSYLFEVVSRDGKTLLGRAVFESEGCGPQSFDVTQIVPEVNIRETAPPRLRVWSVSCEGLLSETYDWVLLDPDPGCAGQTRTSHDGDVNRDATSDVSDAVALAAYLFYGGPRPCSNAADTNDDGRVDLGDVVYLLNQLFG